MRQCSSDGPHLGDVAGGFYLNRSYVWVAESIACRSLKYYNIVTLDWHIMCITAEQHMTPKVAVT
jgi:hypothetical protein